MKKLSMDELNKIVQEKHGAYGTEAARTALDLILGEEFIKNCVESYLSGEANSELICSILRHLRSPFAAEYCIRVLRNESDQFRRENALYIIKELSDFRCLDWFKELIIDKNQNIQHLTIMMLDQFYFCYSSHSNEVEPLAKMAIQSEYPYVKRLAQNILSDIKMDNRRQEILEAAAEKEPGLLGGGFEELSDDSEESKRE